MKDMEKNKIHINCQIKNFDKTLVEMMKIAVKTTLARFNEKEHYSLSILICDDDKIKTLLIFRRVHIVNGFIRNGEAEFLRDQGWL